MSSKTKDDGNDKPIVSPTHKLAYFFWHDIQGNDGSFDDAFKDINFTRRYCSNAKTILKQGADLETVKLALKMMRDDDIMPYSPQQAVDWTRRGAGGKSYYQSAQDEIENRNKKPPIWNQVAYAEWSAKNDNKLQGTAEVDSLEPAS